MKTINEEAGSVRADNESVHSSSDNSSVPHIGMVDREEELRDKIIKTEQQNVVKARLVVIVALVICAVGTCLAVFYKGKTADEETMKLEVS